MKSFLMARCRVRSQMTRKRRQDSGLSSCSKFAAKDTRIFGKSRKEHTVPL